MLLIDWREWLCGVFKSFLAVSGTALHEYYACPVSISRLRKVNIHGDLPGFGASPPHLDVVDDDLRGLEPLFVDVGPPVIVPDYGLGPRTRTENGVSLARPVKVRDQYRLGRRGHIRRGKHVRLDFT